MRPLLLILAGLLCVPAATAQESESDGPQVEMQTYFLVLIRRGPAWTPEQTPEVQAVLEGHFANMQRLADEGMLVLAGPFLDQAPKEGTLTGLFLLQAASVEEAQAIADTDPGVAAGRFTMQVVPWYGPVGITYRDAPPRP